MTRVGGERIMGAMAATGGKWRIRLECDHTKRGLSVEAVADAVAAGYMDCDQCGGLSGALIDCVNKGNVPVHQSRKQLDEFMGRRSENALIEGVFGS